MGCLHNFNIVVILSFDVSGYVSMNFANDSYFGASAQACFQATKLFLNSI